MQQYPQALNYHPPYVWPIRRLTFIPPLLSPHNQHLIAIGLWGEKGPSEVQFSNLKKQFLQWTNQNYYSHYGQVESFDRLTLDAKTYQTLLRYKKQVDPEMLFNQNSLFKSR